MSMMITGRPSSFTSDARVTSARPRPLPLDFFAAPPLLAATTPRPPSASRRAARTEDAADTPATIVKADMVDGPTRAHAARKARAFCEGVRDRHLRHLAEIFPIAHPRVRCNQPMDSKHLVCQASTAEKMGRGRRALLGSDLDSSESDGSEDDASDAEDAELRAAVLANARASAAAPSLNAPGGDLSDGDATRGVPRSATAEVDEEERAILCGDVDDVLNGASMTAARGDTTDAAASTAAGAASNAHAHTAGGIHRRAPRVVTGINAGRIGPELERLREAQEREHGAREYYTEEHYDRLYGRRRPWGRDGRGGKVWCKDVHGQGCTECTSCHFCRQKTADVKTTCQCARWKKTPPGGRGRGAWCGWCLEMRMGENIVGARGRRVAVPRVPRHLQLLGRELPASQARSLSHAAAHARGARTRVAERGALPDHHAHRHRERGRAADTGPTAGAEGAVQAAATSARPGRSRRRRRRG